MRIDSFKSLDAMPEKDLLKIVIANQLNIIYRIERLEKEIAPKSVVDFDNTIKESIGKIESSNRQVNEFLEKNFTEE